MRAHRGARLQRWLAVWCGILLAIAPFTHPSLSLDGPVAAAAVESVAAYGDGIAPADDPAARLRPAPPLASALLSRLSSLETTLKLPPVKSPPLRPSAPEGPLAAGWASAALDRAIGPVFHRSSVGTARTPTGPPA